MTSYQIGPVQAERIATFLRLLNEAAEETSIDIEVHSASLTFLGDKMGELRRYRSGSYYLDCSPA